MARVLSQRTVVRDGFHNAFTDLQHWQGMYWVSYRKGSGHATMDGEAVVAVSVDRERFREVARIKFFGDNRDPKLFPLSEKRMALTIPNWEGEYAGRALRTSIAFSEDGFNWSAPQPIMEHGKWLWRIVEHDGVYYGLVQHIVDDPKTGRLVHGLVLMTSKDLIEWKEHARVGRPEERLNESDIVFREDGEAWLIARSTFAPGYSYFCASRPPYTEWTSKPVRALIHAPAMIEHKGEVYVAGRSRPELEGVAGFPTPASLGVWRIVDGDVEPVLRIPAMGDCSYPGLVKDPEGRVCMTYYSQHAYLMGVVPPFSAAPDSVAKQRIPADVYFAELELP